jgi:hypothetical protein
LVEVRVSIVSDVSIAGRGSAAPEKTRCETHFSELVDGDRCIFSSARACEKNEPIGIRPDRTCRTTCDECRVTCVTRVVKFNVRVSKSRDRRVISSAVPTEKYETAGEVIGTTLVTRDHFRGSCFAAVLENYIAFTVDVDGRGASIAVVKEIHIALVGDGESSIAGGARVVKIRYPKVGADGCVAGGAAVVEVYRPTAGDGGVVGAARVEKIHCPGVGDSCVAGAASFEEIRRRTVNDGGVARRGRAAGFPKTAGAKLSSELPGSIVMVA